MIVQPPNVKQNCRAVAILLDNEPAIEYNQASDVKQSEVT
jgi:hypothetical protein